VAGEGGALSVVMGEIGALSVVVAAEAPQARARTRESNNTPDTADLKCDITLICLIPPDGS